LKIAVSVAKELGKPVGVVVNRERGGFAPLLDYLLKNRLPVLMSLLEDMEIAKEYSKGNLILKGLSGYRERFMELEVGIERLAGIKEQVMA
jgi:MinD superfamily P-loop ATPase